MTQPSRRLPMTIVRPRQPRPRLLRAPAWAALVAASLAGCAAFEAGVPMQPEPVAQEPYVPDPSLPATATEAAAVPVVNRVDADAADRMFQSGEPFARAAGDVNVFGELDGVALSPFDVSGKSGLLQHTIVEEGYDADQTLSPDGRWLLFSSTRHSDRPDLYLQRVGGQAVTQLTSDAADDSFPCFSPDGSQIAFASNRAGNWDLYLMDVDGKNVRQLTRTPGQEIHPSFSPDGSRLVFSALGSRSGQWELWTIDIASGERRMIGFGLFPTWSPRKEIDVIAFQRARQRGTRWFSVWTLRLEQGEARDLTEVAYSPRAAIVAPAWSPDGRRLTFGSIADPVATSPAPSKDVAARATGTQDVWTADADGSNRLCLTDGKGVNASPTWGADGRVYFISDRGGHESIWSTPAGAMLGADGVARRPRLPEVDEPIAQPVAARKHTHHSHKPAAPIAATGTETLRDLPARTSTARAALPIVAAKPEPRMPIDQPPLAIASKPPTANQSAASELNDAVDVPDTHEEPLATTGDSDTLAGDTRHDADDPIQSADVHETSHGH